jgi:hypothetical protein
MSFFSLKLMLMNRAKMFVANIFAFLGTSETIWSAFRSSQYELLTDCMKDALVSKIFCDGRFIEYITSKAINGFCGYSY